jgi:hypothetical protein
VSEQDLWKELEAMSTWTGGETRLWERALESEREHGVRGAGAWRAVPLGWARSPRAAAVLVGAVGVGVLLVAVMGDGSGEGNDGSTSAGVVLGRPFVERDLDRARKQGEVDLASEERRQRFTDSLYSTHVTESIGRDALQTNLEAPLGIDRLVSIFSADNPDVQNPSAIERRVAYSASVSLRSSDVRAVSDRVRALVDTARREFVESFTVSGEGGSAGASVVLRVRSERLEEVLSALRGLGDLVSESVAADDLTARIVDVGARLRNEQRVEAELLELVSGREDLDLEGLVLLRRELGGVRERIEQMESQMAGMNRLVALSTVRITVQGRDATPRTESGWQRFTRGLGGAWSHGLRTLESSVQGMLAFVVGRVVWWAPGVVLVYAGWRMWKRRAR